MRNRTLLRSLLGLRLTALLVYLRILSVRHVWAEVDIKASMFSQRMGLKGLNRRHLRHRGTVDRITPLLESEHLTVRAAALKLLLLTDRGASLAYESVTAAAEAEVKKDIRERILCHAFFECARKGYEGAAIYLPFMLRLCKVKDFDSAFIGEWICSTIIHHVAGKNDWAVERAKRDLIEWVSLITTLDFRQRRRYSAYRINLDELSRLLRHLVRFVAGCHDGRTVIQEARDNLALSMFQNPENSKSPLVCSMLKDMSEALGE